MPAKQRPLARGWSGAEIFAVGHSTRTAKELIELLRAHGVATLADIRTVPRSRTNPQFNLEPFGRALAKAGLRHVHLAELGGRRKARRDSDLNAGWRNASFRGFADYVQSEGFARGLEALRKLAKQGPVAIMCAEGNRWRCHRSLVADALYARGVVVQHIESATRARPHTPTPFARIRGLKVTYPVPRAERRSDAPPAQQNRRSTADGRRQTAAAEALAESDGAPRNGPSGRRRTASAPKAQVKQRAHRPRPPRRPSPKSLRPSRIRNRR
ncbi:MAG: DUF488 domain-containing protein [Myxococcaceae bacterium]|nr:DUF488 domain-containing protein [Myxococcaceae bacterium]